MRGLRVFSTALFAAVVVVSLAPQGVTAADAGAPGAPVDKVLVLSVPGLGWGTVLEEQPPALLRLFARSAVASLSVRTVGADTTAGEGYATMGAGNRATIDEAVAGDAVMVDVRGGGAGAAELEARCGCELDGWELVHLGATEVGAANETLLYDARPGALGTALAATGRRTGVVAGTGATPARSTEKRHGGAVLALMDVEGRVARGTLRAGLGAGDEAAPVSTAADGTTAHFSRVWAEADVVLVEAGELARVDRWSRSSTPPPASEALSTARAGAVARADQLLATLLAEVDLERHLVMVVAPTSGGAGREELAVAAVAGPGISPGLATSASTGRDGYVTLPDVAPTVLAGLALPAPATMSGTPIVSAATSQPATTVARIEALADTNELVTFRDRAVGPVSVAFVVVQLLAYGLGALALSGRPRLRPAAAFLALVTLALPSLAFLSGLVPYPSLGLSGYVAALLVASSALAALALGAAAASAGRTGPARGLVAPLVLVALGVVVLVVDVATGGRLQLNTVFGYSPTVAGRFSGYGNLAFAVVAVGAVLVVTGMWALVNLVEGAPDSRRRRPWLAAVAAALAVVVVAVGHPALGADVGGVLALVPAAAVVVAALAGWRLTPRFVAVVGAATVAVLGAFMAVDLSRPAEARTHLARTAATLFGDGSFVTIIERKARANLEILTSSVWAMLVPVLLAGCALVLFGRRPALLVRLEQRVPGLRAGLVAALVLAVVGGVFNDSGVAVPAMMMAVVVPYLTVLATAEW